MSPRPAIWSCGKPPAHATDRSRTVLCLVGLPGSTTAGSANCQLALGTKPLLGTSKSRLAATLLRIHARWMTELRAPVILEGWWAACPSFLLTLGGLRRSSSAGMHRNPCWWPVRYGELYGAAPAGGWPSLECRGTHAAN